MRASSKRPRVESSVPPPSTSDDSDIHCTLEIVMTVQATHGQLLVDMLNELHAL